MDTHRPLSRWATAGLVLALAACGDGLTAPGATEPPEPPEPPASSASIVEAGVFISSPPAQGTPEQIGTQYTFSLDGLPATLVERLQYRVAIDPTVPASGSRPVAAVDYGDGSGAQYIEVQGGDHFVFGVNGPVLVEGDSWIDLDHIYESAGTFTVKLVVGNDYYRFARSRSFGVTLPPNRAPTATIDLPAEGVEDVPVTFGITLDDPDAQGEWSMTVFYSGGSVPLERDGVERGVEEIFEITFGTSGTKEVSVLVRDGELTGNASANIVIKTLCLPGTFGEPGACEPAPAGSYVDEAGATEATLCAPGSYQPDEGQTSCILAPPGMGVPFEGSTAVYPCATGAYQPNEGSTHCLPAPPGSYVPVTGAAEATPCPVTTFAQLEQSVECNPALPGTYAPEVGMAIPYFCAPGTYQPASGAASCLDADPGHFAWGIEPGDPTWSDIVSLVPDLPPGSMAETQTPCALGTYQPDAGQPSCLPAPLGSYVDIEGAIEATACPAFYITLEVGSTSSADCLPPGHTQAGSGVEVMPLDDATGQPGDVTLTFGNVTNGGLTTVTSGGMGDGDAPPAPTSQFRLGSPATYWEVSTGATFSGAIEICISFGDTSFLDPSEVQLLHDDGSGWVDVTTFVDSVNGIVCGTVTSLSPFILVEPNTAPTVSLGGPYGGSEGSPIAGFAIDAYDADGDAVSIVAWDLGDGRSGSGTPPALVYDDEGVFTVSVTVADALGLETTAETTVSVANVAPALTALVAPMDPVAVGSTAQVEVSFTDPGTLDTHTVTVAWGDGTSSAAALGLDGRSATGSHAYATPGVHTVTVTVDDGDGGVDVAVHQYIVAYDPSAGFVTGGGWIASPAGACTLISCAAAPSGPATFGFVSRYQKGADRPSGNTAFEFEAGGFAFESSAYDWLVVAGARAQFKGTGRINGAGDFGFLLTAIDGEVNGGRGGDGFRIKIWDQASGNVVYDNQRGADDASSSTTALGGGSIRIHDR